MRKQRTSRLRRVNLDHAATAQSSEAASWVLVAAGIAAMFLMFYFARHSSSQIQTLESEKEMLQQPQARPAARMSSGKESPEKREEIAAVNAAMSELKLPWGNLFGMLENIDMPPVRMLAIEPDARQRRLRVTAESNDIESMLAYVHILSRQPILKDVMLLTHEQHNDGRSKPVSFVIEAAWLI